MSKQDPIVSDEELEAFVDARLDASQRARVAACLDACPKTAEAVTAHRRTNAKLCAHFDGVLGEVVPSSLLRTASQAPRAPDAYPRAHRRRVLGIAAGIAAIGLLGTVAGWWWRDSAVLAESTRKFVREAASVLGIPLGTLMSRLHRGRRRLRVLMEGGAPIHLKRVK